jgi:excisionase family DNA binding protein
MNKVKELKQVNGSDFLTTEEAAGALGIKASAVRNYLYLGKLTTYKFKSLTLVDAGEVERWKDRQRER